MKTNFYLFKLTLALVLVGFMIGCGGNTGPKLKSENNSSPDDGKAATDTANKPKATKFTPDMVKAAWEKFDPEGKLGQDPKPAQLEALADKLNENISDGKIDFEGLKVDEITVEALAKGYEAKLKATIEGVLNPEPIPAEEPAEKFTPEMVKAAQEAALKQLPDLFTKEELVEVRPQMMDPEGLRHFADKLNKRIVDGKIDHQGMKVDAITVEALTKALVVFLPEAKREGDKRRNEMISGYRAGNLTKGLISYSDDNDFRFPDSNKWCDAIFKDVGGVEGFYSPQHPDTAKLKDGAPKDKRVSHYALNKAMSGNDGTDFKVVLVFECDLGWNGAGGLEDALKYMDKFKLEKIAVSTADGSSQSVTKEELKKLKWEVAP